MQGPIKTAENIARATTGGTLLLIGCHQALRLMTELLKLHIDTYLLDVFEEAPPSCHENRIIELGVLDRQKYFDTIVILPDAWRSTPEPSGLLSTLRQALKSRLILVFEQPENLLSPSPRSALTVDTILSAGFSLAPDLLSFDALAGDQEGVVAFDISQPIFLGNKNENYLRSIFEHRSKKNSGNLLATAFISTRCRPGDHIVELNASDPEGIAHLKSISDAGRFSCFISPLNAARLDVKHPLLHDLFIKQVPLPIEYIEKSQRHSADLVIVNLTGEGSGAIAALVNNAIQLVKPDGRVILKGDKTSLVEAAEQFGIPPSANSEGTQPIQEAKMLAEECFLLAHVPTDACRAYLQPVNHLREISNDSFALFVLSANPLHVTLPCTYRHPEFEHHAKEVPAVDFGTYYQNPWLYRAMVQNGERIRHEPTLLALSETVIATAAKGSADLGAALTVAGYQLLKNGELDNTGPLLAQIQEYIATNTQSGHSLRWRISLAYLAALIHAARGESQRAEAYFEKVTQEDACKFNPILTTKTISAYFWLGINHLQSGDLETAKNSFANGVRTSLRAMATNQQTTVGDPDAPLAFALQEIAEVADMGAQCAIALRHADRFSTAPASFWRRVSTRRFGLANWLMHLEAENLRLAKENVALEEAAGRQTHSQS